MVESWPKLNDPALCVDVWCEDVGAIVASLQSQPFADRLFGFWSHATFVGTTVPDILQRTSHSDVFSLHRDASGMIVVGYGDPGSAWGEGRENGVWVRRGNWAYCQPEQVIELVARVVRDYFAPEGSD